MFGGRAMVALDELLTALEGAALLVSGEFPLGGDTYKLRDSGRAGEAGRRDEAVKDATAIVV